MIAASMVTYLRKVKFSKGVNEIILGISFFCWATCILTYFNKEPGFTPVLENIFYRGEIQDKTEEMEGDEGGTELVTHYYFKSDEKISDNVVASLNFFTMLIVFGSACLLYYSYSKCLLVKKETDKHDDTFRYIFLSLAMGTFLVLCLLRMPHYYYVITRFVVMIGAIIFAAINHKKNAFLLWGFWVSVAILFNPWGEIYFSD